MNEKRTDGCACDMCKAGCKTKPGFLVPGDLENILVHLQIPSDDKLEFVKERFEASEGATVADFSTGKTFQIPTIVPAQQPDGRCTFLTEDDRCSVHAVSPFGCREFNICDTTADRATEDAKISDGLRAILNSQEYEEAYVVLCEAGRRATPTKHRQQALVEELQRLEKPPNKFEQLQRWRIVILQAITIWNEYSGRTRMLLSYSEFVKAIEEVEFYLPARMTMKMLYLHTQSFLVASAAMLQEHGVVDRGA